MKAILNKTETVADRCGVYAWHKYYQRVSLSINPADNRAMHIYIGLASRLVLLLHKRAQIVVIPIFVFISSSTG